MEGSLVAYKVFTNGSVLNASEINENLMQQSVATFSNSAARSAAITSPVEGQMTYLLDIDRYSSWSGSAWIPVVDTGAWTAYTPTFTNFTLGNGTINFAFTQIGKTVHLRGFVQLGSTSSMGTNPFVSLPVSAAVTSGVPVVAFVKFGDLGTANYEGFGMLNTSTLLQLGISNVAGTYPAMASVSATVPHTWASTDLIIVNATYQGV
jgi:hypothetical protein